MHNSLIIAPCHVGHEVFFLLKNVEWHHLHKEVNILSHILSTSLNMNIYVLYVCMYVHTVSIGILQRPSNPCMLLPSVFTGKMPTHNCIPLTFHEQFYHKGALGFAHALYIHTYMK